MASDFFRAASGRFIPLLMLLIPLTTPQALAAETLLVLGDSISAGYGIREEQGWVQLLRERLRDGEKPIEVVNASVSGETSSGGLARLPRLLQEHQPQWLIIELGGNDGLRGYPPRLLAENLQKLVHLAKGAKARVLILGMRMPPNYGRAYSDAFAGVFPQVAEAEQVPLVPFFLETVALQKGAMQADGIHPTVQAQPKLLEHVWPCVSQLLDAAEAQSGCSR
jgi:acyl-CoA thioesterase-1